VARKLPLVQIRGCRSVRRNPSDADMGTDTLFVHETKAAASCRTPNALRLPTPTAFVAARLGTIGISGEIE